MCRWGEPKGFSIITEFMARRKDPVYRELLALEHTRYMGSAVSLPFSCSRFFLFFSQSNTRTLSPFLRSLIRRRFYARFCVHLKMHTQRFTIGRCKMAVRDEYFNGQNRWRFHTIFFHVIERNINFIIPLRMMCVNTYYLRVKFLICASKAFSLRK